MKNKFIFAAFAALFTVGCDNYAEDEKETITDTFLQEMEHVLTREDTINAMALAFVKQESNFNNTAVSPCWQCVGRVGKVFKKHIIYQKDSDENNTYN